MKESIVHLIGSFVNISILYLLMFLYISIIVLLFYHLRFWDFSLLKDTIFWTFSIAFVLLFNINNASSQEYFKKAFFNCFKLVILLEFITNLYTFNLIIELISIPFIVFLGISSVFGEIKEEYRSVKKTSDFLLSIYGITVIIFSIYHAIIDFEKLFTINNLKTILLSPILTTLYIPYIYFTALFMAYESFYKSRRWILQDNTKVFMFLMWHVLKKCNFSLNKVHLISRKIHIYRTEEKAEILKDLNIILRE